MFSPPVRLFVVPFLQNQPFKKMRHISDRLRFDPKTGWLHIDDVSVPLSTGMADRLLLLLGEFTQAKGEVAVKAMLRSQNRQRSRPFLAPSSR